VRVKDQSDLWKKLCRITLPLIEKLIPNDCYNIRDKPISKEEWDFIGMPKGFDGSMYVLGKHIYQYIQEKVNHHPKYRTYAGTTDLQPGLATMAPVSFISSFASFSLRQQQFKNTGKF